MNTREESLFSFRSYEEISNSMLVPLVLKI